MILLMLCHTWHDTVNIAGNDAHSHHLHPSHPLLSVPLHSAALQCLSAHAQTGWKRATTSLSSETATDCITDTIRTQCELTVQNGVQLMVCSNVADGDSRTGNAFIKAYLSHQGHLDPAPSCTHNVFHYCYLNF